MSMYRCAACGSPNVQRSDRNDGFSYKKALVGTAVFGAVGAVAGINGKTTIQYQCPDCGYVGSSAMNDMEKTMVDMAVSSSEEVFQRMPSFQEYMQKYKYLVQERTMRNNTATMNSLPVNQAIGWQEQSEYSLAEVRKAVEDFHAAFDNPPKLTSIDPPYWKEHPIQDIEVYEKAFDAMRIIANGLYAYPMLITGEHDGNFSRYDLKRAFIGYILTIHGALREEEIIEIADRDPYLKRTMQVLFDQNEYNRKIRPYPYKINNTTVTITPDKKKVFLEIFMNRFAEEAGRRGKVEGQNPFVVAPGFESNLDFNSGDKEVKSYNVYPMPNEQTPIEFGYKIANHSLYVCTVDVVSKFESEHPEINNELVELFKQKNAIKKIRDQTYWDSSANKALDEQIKRLQSKNEMLKAEAVGLRSKFFGKKKNEALAIEKDMEVKNNLDQIAQFEAKKPENEKNKNAKVSEYDEKIKGIDKEILKNMELRSQYFREIDRWVCIAGADCISVPTEDPEAIAARERAERSLKVFEGRTLMETTENIKERVYEVLKKNGNSLQVLDIMQLDEDLAGLNSMKIAVSVNMLVEEGKVVKSVQKRHAYYQAK